MQGLICPEGAAVAVVWSSKSGKTHSFSPGERTYSPGPLLTPLEVGIQCWWKCLNMIVWKEMNARLRGQLLHVGATRSGLGWSVFGANTLFFSSACLWQSFLLCLRLASISLFSPGWPQIDDEPPDAASQMLGVIIGVNGHTHPKRRSIAR